MAKMAMLVIAFEDLKKPVETSYSGYCASHPPLALPENLESRRYREVWFLDTLFFLPFRHRYIGHDLFLSKTRALWLTKLYKIKTSSRVDLEEKNQNCALG